MKKYREEIENFKSLPADERFNFLVKYWKLEESVFNNSYIQLVGRYQKSNKVDKNANCNHGSDIENASYMVQTILPNWDGGFSEQIVPPSQIATAV